MSALGQKRTSEHVQSMSALPPKADIGTQPCDVRFVPKADIGCHQLTWLLRRGQSATLEVLALAKPYRLDVEWSAHQPNDWSIASPFDR